MKKHITTWLERLDTWLCIFLPVLSLRLWWCRLWVRKDEFHASLDTDTQILLSFKSDSKKREDYMKDLVRRRNIAHLRDFPLAENLGT